MNPQQQEISDQQKASWNKFSGGWKKWDDLMMDFLKPVGNAIIQYVAPKNNDRLLDVASGTGEPGLSMAALIPDGKVVLTDLSPDMLEVAREHATGKGLKNVDTQVCDVSHLPFPDHSFDAVSCRFGFMFFPDMLLAAQEMVRVLKPGGKIAASVWAGPEQNFWVTAVGNVIYKHMHLSPPPPEAPGMFRCATPGLLQQLFSQAGLKNVTEKEVAGHLNAGTAEVFWNMMTEVAAPFVAALSKADEAMQKKIKEEAIQLVRDKYPDNKVSIASLALLVCGEK